MHVRRAVTAARLLLTAATALAAATFVTQVLALGSSASFATPPAAHAPSSSTAAARNLSADRGYALFGLTRPLEDQGAFDATACDEAPTSTLALRLVGTVVSPLPEASAASIAVGGAKEPADIFSLGDAIGDVAVVERIDSERVCVMNLAAGRRESLALGGEPARGEPPAATSTKPVIERDPDGSFRVSGAALDQALSDPNLLARSARFSPAFKDGAIVGYRVATIAKGSPLAGVLEKGDVVTHVNGVPLSDMNKSLELLASLRERGEFRVEGTRGKKPLSLVVHLDR